MFQVVSITTADLSTYFNKDSYKASAIPTAKSVVYDYTNKRFAVSLYDADPDPVNPAAVL